MKVSELLIAAKAKIDSVEKWTKGTGARNAAGEEVMFDRRDEACSFCTIGAIGVVEGHMPTEPGSIAIDLLCANIPPEFGKDVVEFNDDEATTHADVMALFDRAIEKARASETQ